MLLFPAYPVLAGGLVQCGCSGSHESQSLDTESVVSLIRYRASHGQRGLWLLQELSPESAAYNAMSTWRIPSRVDIGALERAWAGVAERHDAIRTTYRVLDDALTAEVGDGLGGLVRVDARGWTAEALMQRVSDEAHRPFDLERGPTFRAMLFTASAEDHVLLISAHHIGADGWSNRILMQELGALYRAHAAGLPSSLPAPGPSCEEFARWQAEMLAGPAGERLWSFWSTELGGDLPRLDLATDHPRRAVRRHRGASESIALDRELTSAVGRLARSRQTTPFVVLLSAFQVLLARYTGQDDIAIGSIAHGRSASRFRRSVGNLMNQVLLRTDLSGEPSFADLLDRTRQTVRGALAHQTYPFSLLVERLAPQRDPGRSALADVTFGLTYLIGESRATLDWGQFSLTAFPVPRRSSQTDLDVQLVESCPGMSLVFQYDSDLFEAETIRRMSRHYVRLLRAFCAGPTQRVSEAPLLEEERRRLIAGWTPADREGTGLSRVDAIVEAQVDRTPEAVAVAGGGRRLSYRMLDERANQVARRLRRLGAGPEVSVAICLDRSPDLIVGLLGILKAGAAYVPLDPSLPPARLAFAIEDSRACAVVSQERFRSLLPAPTIPILFLDEAAAGLDDEPAARLAIGASRSDRDRAYVSYTSGSTGVPKGVEVEHRGVANAIRDVIHRLRLGPADVWTAITTIAFDVASLEIWGALAAGARLEMVDASVVADGERLVAAIRDAGTTVMLGTPTLWRLVLSSGWSGQPRLKMISGGEPLTRDLADALLQRGAALWNQYGPTEATMYATTEEIARSPEPPTIGRTIANVRAYVLDERGEPVPTGVAGELWIAGIQVARGYLNRPDETARAFADDPWVPGDRRYRTGDLARYRADGRLEYLGRLDTQVKIRGHRVELGEIEAAIERHPAIRSAVVLAPTDRHTGPAGGSTDGERGPTAYLVASDHTTPPPSAEGIVAFLQTRLPAHMVPSEFRLLDALPVTASGKVDRRAVATAAATRLEGARPVVAPRTGLEETVARIWADVLKLERVGVHENFFELGGHSLLATQIVSRIRETLHVELPLRHLFEGPTVAALVERIAAELGDGRAIRGVAIEPRRHEGPARLSFAQERMWFLNRLAPDSAAYNVPAAVRLRGPLNTTALSAAVRDIALRHEILRAVFPMVDGRPVQVVTEHQMTVPLIDLQNVPDPSREARARKVLREEGRRPFDLVSGPVVRILLVRLGPADHVLLLNMHHIVCDQWSFAVLGRELISLYRAHCAGEPHGLSPLAIQFADFANWQREWLSGPVLASQLAYWRRHLGGPLPILDLPADRTRPPAPSYEGGWETRRLSSTLVAAVEALSRHERASVFMSLMAGFTALLARYSRQSDVLIGVPIANRNHLASEDLMGNLVNTLPIRTDVDGDPTFRELLRRVRSTLLDAYAHQDMPFDRLVLELQPERYASHSPLVHVLMNLLNVPMPRQSLADLAWEPFPFERGSAQFDLTLTVDWGRESSVFLEYSSDLFDRTTAGRILDHFVALVQTAVADPDRRLSDISLLNREEREQLLVTWNRTARSDSPDGSIHALFEVQADRTPDAVAVVAPDGVLTYRELDGRANQLARHLQTLGVGREIPVGICLDRSRMTFIALLGVLKAGAAFVPLDPSYPPGRLDFMLSDSGATVLLTDARHAPGRMGAGVRAVLLDVEWPTIERQSAARLASAVEGDRLAYVMYTSGSTGTPKGVLGLHRGALNRFNWMWRTYPFQRGEVCCQKTSTSFVDSIWEIFGPLLQGIPTVVIPDEIVREPRRLIAMLAEYRVTRIVLVPSLLRAMIDTEPALGVRLPHLRLWVSSGETLGHDLARRFRDAVALPAVLLNLYGSSEAAGDSTFHEVEEASAPVSIGRPIDNTEIYILDDRREPVPVGAVGELYIGGHGLARGYLNRPELTAERFVANPFSGRAGARMYRTGDRGRYLKDGTIEYLGRVDSQVKVRGFRIDLSEVESVLAAHPDVAKAVAVTQEENTADARVVGYVVPQNGVRPTDILAFARRWLPGYMIPAAIVVLEAIPLTPNGKVDRRALPAPRPGRPDVADRPHSAIEATLAELWAQLLGLPEIGVNENFFDLGGHSLLAAQLVSRMEEAFLTSLPLRSLFDAPTVARFAALIEVLPVTASLKPLRKGEERVEIEL